MTRGRRELERIRRLYDRAAGRYERFMTVTEGILRTGRREVGEAATGDVLEVAIGTGLSLPWYGAGVRSLTGVDLSPGMLNQCASRAPTAFPVRLAIADAQQLPFPAARFDTVVFTLCLCTIPDPARAVREAVRVASPGARMLFLEHVRSNVPPLGLLQDVITPATRLLGADHFNRRSAATIRQSGVIIDAERRWALGIVSLVRGRSPLG